MADWEMPLPHKDSPEIKLVIATPTELLAQQHANSIEWRGALTHEAYFRREEILYDQDLTRNGGLTPWLLIHDLPSESPPQPPSNGSTISNQDKPRRILCSCESINKLALVLQDDGQVRDVVAHGVASVFCAPELRGRGYAGRMMQEVNDRLRRWQMVDDRESAMSILFSDIGKKFYAARGWQPFPSAHIALTVGDTGPSPSKADLPEVKKLHDCDMAELCKLDEAIIRKQLVEQHRSGRTSIATVPDARTMAWHHARERFVANELLGKSPSDTGAMVGETLGTRVWCYWMRVWTNPNEQEPNTLHILRLVIEDDVSTSESTMNTDSITQQDGDHTAILQISALLDMARRTATEWGMKQVHIWNPTPTTLAAARLIDQECHFKDREEESIASLLWYGEESWQDIDWLCNEKYAWC